MNKVSIVKCENYDQENIDSAVNIALKLIGGIDDLIKPGINVLLKPNLLMAIAPENGTTTHPAIVKAMIKKIQELGGNVSVGDSSSWSTDLALKKCGIIEVAESLNAKALNFNEFTPETIQLPEESVLEEIHVAKPVVDADVIISLPKLKVHELMGFTGAIKNHFGTIVGQYKGLIHKKLKKPSNFAKGLIDIYLQNKPELILMDGVISVKGTAGKGKPKKIGVILASRDGFALDTVAASIIKLKLEKLPVNKQAIKRGIEGNKLEEVEVVGETIENINVRFKKVNTVTHGFMSLFHSIIQPKAKQKVKKKLCIKCEVCLKICPVEAITMNPYPIFNFKECIRCYCCKEVCQQGAIKVKVPIAARIVGFR